MISDTLFANFNHEQAHDYKIFMYFVFVLTDSCPPLHFSPFLKTAWKQLNYRDRSFLVFNQSSVNY